MCAFIWIYIYAVFVQVSYCFMIFVIASKPEVIAGHECMGYEWALHTLVAIVCIEGGLGVFVGSSCSEFWSLHI